MTTLDRQADMVTTALQETGEFRLPVIRMSARDLANLLTTCEQNLGLADGELQVSSYLGAVILRVRT